MPAKQGKDRRIERTRGLLHEAMGSLIREKNYDAITVQEILDRANVGRSTFYMHFRDKDELLVSGIHQMLGALRPDDGRTPLGPVDGVVWFSLPVFAHIDAHRRAGPARMGARGRAIIHEYLRKVLVELIVDEVRRRVRSARKPASRIPPDLLAQHVASTFVLVLNWWLESKSALSPEEVDAMFRALIPPALAEA